MASSERLLERFLRYVQVDTTAIEGVQEYPSSSGQLRLGAQVVRELHELGIEDAQQDDHGIVMGTIPSNGEKRLPVVAFNAHFDTSPETTGAGVRPQVVRDYSGGDLTLPGDPDQVIRVSENPELSELIGTTLITTDGTTLLGGDDKAGIAVIMELAARLAENPQIKHGPIRVLFTCDEEIGRGVEFVDLDRLDATVCYTLDGPAANQIDVETFSADLALVCIQGINIHPAIAQDRMVNAVRAAAEFVAQMPRDQAPETTSGRDGFLHPYGIEGGVDQVLLKIILRDFETAALSAQIALLRELAANVENQFPGCRVSVETRPQYRNLRDSLVREPRVVQFAELAHQRLGRTARLSIIRGGTDGSQLSERGLPTPNLSTGQHNPHSPLEWVCLQEMEQAVAVLQELVQIWASSPDSMKE